MPGRATAMMSLNLARSLAQMNLASKRALPGFVNTSLRAYAPSLAASVMSRTLTSTARAQADVITDATSALSTSKPKRSRSSASTGSATADAVKKGAQKVKKAVKPKAKKAAKPKKPKVVKAKKPKVVKPKKLKSALQPPKPPGGPLTIFVAENLKGELAQTPTSSASGKHSVQDIRQAFARVAERYKSLSSSEQAALASRAAEARTAYESQLSEFRSSLTPEMIRQENKVRFQQRKGGKRIGNLRDPDAPKRPSTAFFLFLTRGRNDPSSVGLQSLPGKTTEQTVVLAGRWKEMSDAEKEPYVSDALRLREEYKQASARYESSLQHA
ncbi:hypothetical protein E5Q_05678 [Mixia osmundae IAM 14324]|uniref:HMG box domain-containing protein n=1 Tax=Mixia osmundae (strain CBS 9802 / IAM 14324 / JCM 22182 / KY 12970) TaxID=764103 RepID=G7E829_MIXOS|nr:hypothetical protein E5Q_05678 [Mixia osmundae IAM 14324]